MSSDHPQRAHESAPASWLTQNRPLLSRGLLHRAPYASILTVLPVCWLAVLLGNMLGQHAGWDAMVPLLFGLAGIGLFASLEGVAIAAQALHPFRSQLSGLSVMLLVPCLVIIMPVAHLSWSPALAAEGSRLAGMVSWLSFALWAELVAGFVLLVLSWRHPFASMPAEALGLLPREAFAADAKAKSAAHEVDQHGARGNLPTDSTGKPIDVVAKYPAREPRLGFDDVIGMSDAKAKLLDAAARYADEDANGILLYGPPGSGKTTMAEALAARMNFRILVASVGDIDSKWMKESMQNLVSLFRAATMQATPERGLVLFFDEIDALIQRPDGGSSEENTRMVRQFLTEIVELRRENVLFIGATNWMDRLDEAAIREGRFDFKIEVPLPDAAAIEGIARATLAREERSVDDALLLRMVRHWAGFTVPRIQAVVEGACRTQKGVLSYADFHAALRAVQGHDMAASGKALALDELILDPGVRSQVDVLVARLARTDEIIAQGGSQPAGAILTGPPGTGKTTLAASMTKASGRTFVSTTGADLMKAGAIDAIARRASDYRPSVIFIDEGDEVLANRNWSGVSSLTNQILVLMDGAREGRSMVDVFWIVATNNADKIDPAVLRGGRLEIKIEMGLPTPAMAKQMLSVWVDRHPDRISGVREDWIEGATSRLAGLSQADIGSILGHALNGVIARKVLSGSEAAPAISLDDLIESRREITGLQADPQ